MPKLWSERIIQKNVAGGSEDLPLLDLNERGEAENEFTARDEGQIR